MSNGLTLPFVGKDSTDGTAFMIVQPDSGGAAIGAESFGTTRAGDCGVAIWAETDCGIGVQAQSGTGTGVQAQSETGTGVAAYSRKGTAVWGLSESGPGVTGVGPVGVFGMSDSPDADIHGGAGVRAQSNDPQGSALVAEATAPGGVAIYAQVPSPEGNGVAVWAECDSMPVKPGRDDLSRQPVGVLANCLYGPAGVFHGDVQAHNNMSVDDTFTAAMKLFKIDHPLDPANKYLFHASVESFEMINMYSGNVTTDAAGEATVSLPDYFGAINSDFRYQLTVVGQFAHAIVASEIKNSRFAIRTDKPHVKVSWQVTGLRQDNYAKSHALIPEQEKPPAERGLFLHPELFHEPKEKKLSIATKPRRPVLPNLPVRTVRPDSPVTLVRPGLKPK
jgi:hypothetical protein